MLIESYTKFIYSFIEKILSESDILLSSKFIDGRDNSRRDEHIIADVIIEKLGNFIKKSSDTRSIGDIYIDMSVFGVDDIPINIKSVYKRKNQYNNAFGLSSFIGYTYNKPCRSNISICDVISNYNEKELNKYMFIIYSKNTRDVWIGTFDQIANEDICINPTNGIQIKFPTKKVYRSDLNYHEMLINLVGDFFKKRAEPYNRFKQIVIKE